MSAAEVVNLDDIHYTIDTVGHAVPAVSLAQMGSGLDQDEDWLAARRKGIGSSDAPGLLGLSPWAGPYAIWLKKVKGITNEVGVAAEWGHRLENVVANAFADKNSTTVHRVANILAHPERDWQLANLDRATPIDGDMVPLEIKTTGRRWWDGPYADTYNAQVQHQLAVTGCTHAYLAILIGGQEYEQHRIERDDEFIARMVEVEQEFWQHVTDEVPPPYDGSRDTMDYLGSLQASGQVVFDDRLLAKAKRLAALKRELKGLRDQRYAIEAELKASMGEAAVAVDERGVKVASWTSYQTNRVSAKKVRELHPEILEDVLDTGLSRRFDLKVD